MNIKEKLMLDYDGLNAHGPINVVIFGDSVSHGAINGYNDYESVYWNRLKRKLNTLRDYMPVNMINSSIGGTTASASVKRLQRDVLKHEPDLVIVCFGLNDVNASLESYTSALETIFSECKKIGSDVIFMTPNMLNTTVMEDTPKQYYDYAFKTAEMQNGGRMDTFMSEGIKVAKSLNVTVCDCYAKWKKLAEKRDITLLLANRINHPIPEMHELFAESLFEIIIGDPKETVKSDSTMYRQKID